MTIGLNPSYIKARLNESLKLKFLTEATIDQDDTEELNNDDVAEEVQIDEAGRFKIVRVRIRNGKIQRRKKVSTVKGYTFRKGKFVRMSASERRHRKVGARRAKIKRRSERSRIRLHMKRALRKRKSLGL